MLWVLCVSTVAQNDLFMFFASFAATVGSPALLERE